MTAVALEVFFAHPLEYVVTIPVGLYRFLLEVRPVLPVDSGWLPLLWLGIAWNGLLLIAAAAGLLRILRQRRWAGAAFLTLPCAYFLFGTLLVQTSGIDTRARVMVTPLLAVMAAYGAWRILSPQKAASAAPSPPADS